MKNRTVRCRLVFLLLAGLFVILAALSFSVGSVSLSLRDMCEILSGADRESTAFHILWDIRLPRLACRAAWRGSFRVWIFAQTFFANPIAGPFVLEFLRGQAGGGFRHDPVSGKGSFYGIRVHDRGGVCRIYAFHGVCTGDRTAGKADACAGGMRCYDQLYLFCNHGFRGDLCR